MLNLNKILASTYAEGPGNRFCIWTQGCLNDCVGCCNVGLQPLIPKILIEEEKLCEQIKEAKDRYSIEGITFLGGEPLLQAKALATVAKYCQKIGLSVICFTGYIYPNFPDIVDVADFLGYVDVLIDGPYIQEEQCTKRNWVGSANQRFLYFSNTYNKDIETMSQAEIEVRLFSTEIMLNGNPNILSYRDIVFPK